MHDNLLLWPEQGLDALASSAHAETQGPSVARSWLDPSRFNEVVGVDFGLGRMHYYMGVSGRRLSVGVESALATLLSMPANTLIVCEWAHLAVPQTFDSLAQLFTESELLEFYAAAESRRLTVKLFPHAHSRRAREWVAYKNIGVVDSSKTSDINDAAALALFVTHCNDISLANPPRSFARCCKRDYGRDVIKLSNIVLNAERTREYSGKMFPAVLEIARAVRRKCGERAIDLKAAVSIVSTVVHEIHGRPVIFTRNGQTPGGRLWLRNVVRFTPFHHRGGIVRSNLLWHKFRPWLARYGESRGVSMRCGRKYQRYAHFDARQKAIHTSGMRVFRAAVLKAYRISVDVAKKKGCVPMEPKSVLAEVRHGR